MKTICDVAYQAYLDFKQRPHQDSDVGYITSSVVDAALQHMPLTTVRDNISCVGVFFEWEGQAPVTRVVSVEFPES